MSKSEKLIQSEIVARLNSRPDVRVFRNNIGVAFIGDVIAEKNGDVILRNARRVRFGLHEGSGDLIGWKTMEITPDMVGSKIAVFFSAEIKTPQGRIREEQKNWIVQVTKAGGIAKVMRSAEECDKLLNKNICEQCGQTGDDVTLSPDPYEHDINNDDTTVWLCSGCRQESCDAI